MVQLFLVMHEPLGQAFQACARHVLGVEPGLTVVDIPPDADPDTLVAELVSRLSGDMNQQTLILCDIFGATPFNIANRARKLVTDAGGNVCVLAGANLSMVLKALTDPSGSMSERYQRASASAVRAVANPDQPAC
ncbi:MAG: PTS sugar transporter subunit IIA [Alcaligenaceae bacterium]|nr:PTS sugar transporter subunit IIA [Alcaligenaceae bacterium]